MGVFEEMKSRNYVKTLRNKLSVKHGTYKYFCSTTLSRFSSLVWRYFNAIKRPRPVSKGSQESARATSHIKESVTSSNLQHFISRGAPSLEEFCFAGGGNGSMIVRSIVVSHFLWRRHIVQPNEGTSPAFHEFVDIGSHVKAVGSPEPENRLIGSADRTPRQRMDRHFLLTLGRELCLQNVHVVPRLPDRKDHVAATPMLFRIWRTKTSALTARASIDVLAP